MVGGVKGEAEEGEVIESPKTHKNETRFTRLKGFNQQTFYMKLKNVTISETNTQCEKLYHY